PALFQWHRVDPRHPAAALRRVLARWTVPPAPRPLSVAERVDAGTITEGLPALYAVADLARWLGLTVGEREWFAGRGGWLRTAAPRLRHNREWASAKRDGVRVIEPPKPRMREVHRQLVRLLVSRMRAHAASTGFLPGSSTVD